MPYLHAELDRIMELYERIEGRKQHENAAPTWRDADDLKELSTLSEKHQGDEEALEDTAVVLSYLAECYDRMVRPGKSAEYYDRLISCLVRIGETDADNLEDALYRAAKARNFFEPDACEDYIALASPRLPEEKVREIISSAAESRRTSIKYDPVEKTKEYLAVIDEVEREIDEAKTTDLPQEYWNLKSYYLSQRGIDWRSPAELNPGVMFD